MGLEFYSGKSEIFSRIKPFPGINALQSAFKTRDDIVRHGGSPLKNPFFTTLVVDGATYYTGVLEDFLKDEGHFIIRAESAEVALGKTRQFQPDLILLDNQLEGITGLALLGVLLMAQPCAAVIMLASNPSISESVEAIKRGAVDYLYRPLDVQRLKAAMDTQKALFTCL